MEKHGYVRLIEYALENKNFSKDQACSVAKISQSDFDFISNDIFTFNASQGQNISSNEEREWKLTTQAYFSYLQYSEYRHSIKTAKRAHYISIISIIISGLLALISIIVSLAG